MVSALMAMASACGWLSLPVQIVSALTIRSASMFLEQPVPIIKMAIRANILFMGIEDK
jgi:hypothetical protein